MKYPSNLLSELKLLFSQELKHIYGLNEADNLINILIGHYTGLSRINQALHPDFRLSESELVKFHFAIKRLLKSEPIQYILGESLFYGLKFEVNPTVLIPRPETEELVGLIVRENLENQKILDIGTGSGCIAITLKSRFPGCMLTGLDLSKKALETARRNATKNSVTVKFIRGNILQTQQLPNLGMFNIIVSNPPYVTEADKKQMNDNVVAWEPHVALFAPGSDPLSFYRHILFFSKNHLAPAGMLFFEINENFGQELKILIEAHGFKQVTIHKDINKKERFISVKK